MSEEIFDQQRPRSTMAQRLDEAFAGCEEWTIAPPSKRRSESADLAPWLSGRPQMIDRAAAARPPEQRAA